MITRISSVIRPEGVIWSSITRITPSMCYMLVDYSLCLSGTELPVLLSASVLLGLVLAQNIRERLMTDHHRRTATC